MRISRRAFLGGLCPAAGGLLAPLHALGESRPNLRLGVVSDVHIGAKEAEQGTDTEVVLEKALRWFDAQGVDAVAVPGDIAHSGKIEELERFAAIWSQVFHGDRRSDGCVVEKLFVTGNHDLAAFWVKGDDEYLSRVLFAHKDNPGKVWNRLFNEEFLSIWKKEVKGYTFVGSQWPTGTDDPPVEAWFREHAEELHGSKPFFYLQHAHPKGTCGDGKTSSDDGRSTRALAAFGNAVAITGHSHQTLTDESSVWQGSFTSVNAGCLRGGENSRSRSVYDSSFPIWHRSWAQNRMMPLDTLEGGGCLLIDVFDAYLRVGRHSLFYDRPLGDDWVIALPARSGGRFDNACQRAASVGPAFPPDAQLEATVCRVAPQAIAGLALRGKPCVWLKIPHPQTVRPGSRVYDFEIDVWANGRQTLKRTVLANGFNVPESKSDRLSHCLFGIEELPLGEIRFVVRPRNSFGVAGQPIDLTFQLRS